MFLLLVLRIINRHTVFKLNVNNSLLSWFITQSTRNKVKLDAAFGFSIMEQIVNSFEQVLFE